jgi:uncharacterized protein YjbI with pentapeptide repeats
MLREGVGVWNQWREEHPDGGLDFIEPDLSGANLIDANLAEANLS